MPEPTDPPTGTHTPDDKPGGKPPAAPPAPSAPPAPPAPAPAPPAPEPPAPPTGDPDWLKPRLERQAEAARAALLADLGITDPTAAKEALAAAAAAAEANKTAEQRAAEAAAKLTQTQAERDKLNKITAEHASRMMVAISPEQQKAVKDIAGDDPAEQLRVIGVMSPTWAAQDAESQAAAAAAAAAAAPGNTAPAGKQPGGGAPGSPPDNRAVYSQLKTTNPFRAAAFGQQHREVYETPT